MIRAVCERRTAGEQRGFSFIEVMIAMAILAVGSVSILALLAVGVRHQLDRRTEARIQKVKNEIHPIIQAAVDEHPPGKELEDLENVPLSVARYSLDVTWVPRPQERGGWFARAAIRDRNTGQVIRVLGPYPVNRSSIDPEEIVSGGRREGN